METLKISGLFARIPENRFFLSVHDALTFLAAGTKPKSGHVPGAVLSSTHDARPAVLALSSALPVTATIAGQSCQYSKTEIP
jgi:hypothetical protein